MAQAGPGRNDAVQPSGPWRGGQRCIAGLPSEVITVRSMWVGMAAA